MGYIYDPWRLLVLDPGTKVTISETIAWVVGLEFEVRLEGLHLEAPTALRPVPPVAPKP